jgi:hypothetical protein
MILFRLLDTRNRGYSRIFLVTLIYGQRIVVSRYFRNYNCHFSINRNRSINRSISRLVG